MNFKQALKAAQLNLKQAAPDILVILGIALSGAAVVEACRKTREAEPFVDEFKEDMDIVKEAIQTEEAAPFARDKAIEATKKVTVGLAKAYWKPALMWTASTVCIVKSHMILKDRNVALAALATGLGTELRMLHQRIIDRYGEEVDRELKYGVSNETVEEMRIDEASGSEVVDQKQVPVVRTGDDDNGPSIYARFFDEASRCWRKDPEYNLALLKALEHDCNVQLQENGVLFLNEVYDKLDIPRTKAGQNVGWRYYKNPEDNLYGDNKVVFGIYNTHRAGNRDFVNGYEPVVLLDFNVDGAVINALPLR